MPLKINAKTITGIIGEKLSSKKDLCSDVHLLAGVIGEMAHANITASGGSAFRQHLLTAITKGISAGNRLLDDECAGALDVSAINALERFAVLHFTSVQRSFLRGLESVVGTIDFDADGRPPEAAPRTQGSRNLQHDIQRAIELVLNLDVPYTLSVNPSSQLGMYFKELVGIISGIIGILKGGWANSSSLNASIEIAMADYASWSSDGTAAAARVKSYLNYEQQQISRSIVSDDVQGLSVALQDWLRANTAMSDHKKEMWRAYRRTLSELPDGKDTMFAENFGVRKVFVQPLATYRVAGVKNDYETPIVADVAGLIGTLISDRTEGDDLILLAGGPGSGKSTLCRILASELAANENVHPVFLRLRRLQESHDIRGFIETELQGMGLIDKVSDLASVPNLVLILDGFDELVMASRAKLREFFNALKEDLSTGPLRHAKAIVSGRDTLFPSGAGLPMGAHLVSLQPFDTSRIAAWGSKWRDQHTQETAQSFYPETLVSQKKTPGLKPSPLEHLVSWPLTLHLVARAHTSGSIALDLNKADQVDKAVLYRSIVADTAVRQEDQAGGRNRLNPQQMRRFVRAIAWEMYSTGREALDVSEGLPILRSIYPGATESDLSELADVTIVNQPELTKGEETGFEFVHKSFSEYFAAETIANKIEEVCFKVVEWGAEEKTWRMSVKDATSALASLFAIRLLTEEVQEMLAPMMDDFELFLREPGDTSQPDPAALTRNLETKLERFEGLLQQFAAGGLLRDVAAAAQQRRTSANELESFGNYASALLFISVALVLRIDVHDREQRRSVRIAAPVLIRLLHIVLAGEIAIDWPYSMRALNRIDARRPDHDRIELSFPPLAPNLLENVRGLESHLEEAIVTLDAKSTALEVENILLSMLVDISGSHQQASATFRNIRFDHRYRYESAPIEFLQRMVNSRHREQFGSIRNLERRMHELTEYLHSSYGGALPPDVVHDAIMRLREISHESRYRGAAQSELFQRVERMLQESFDPDGRARPLPRARRAKPKNA